MKTLYVIGNGFDIFHGLRTKYADFHQFVVENYPDLENDLENFFNFQIDEEYLWKEFESDLCKYNYRSLFDDMNHLDIMDESFKPSQCFGLQDDITQRCDELVQNLKEALLSWIESIDYSEIASPLLNFHEDSFFLNFNYTDTLEEVYQIPKHRILYLHNNASDFNGELILGHGVGVELDPKESEIDADGNSNRTLFTDAEDAARFPFYALQKDTEAILLEHIGFFEQLKDIKQIFVLGHSLGKADWPYFQKLSSVASNANWNISYRDPIDKQEKQDLAKEMFGKKQPHIALIQFSELELF